jgi:hypothetical protein
MTSPPGSDRSTAMTASGVWKRYMRLRNSGWDMRVLADKPRKDKGTSRVLAKYPKAAKFLLARFKDNISVAHAYDELKGMANLYNHGSQPPSYSTIRAYYANHSSGPARHGPPHQREARQALSAVPGHRLRRAPESHLGFRSPHSRRIRSERRLRSRAAAARDALWETAIEDMHSRTIVASVWCTSPSSRSIASALRQAISRLRPAGDLLHRQRQGLSQDRQRRGSRRVLPANRLDRGRPRSDHRRRRRFLARLGIKVKYCTPFHPQSKLIESFFSHQSKRFDKIFGVATQARSRRSARMHATTRSRAHKKYLNGQGQPSRRFRSLPSSSRSRFWTDEYNTLTSTAG